MQQILRLRLTSHTSGWSAEAWGLVREAASFIPVIAVHSRLKPPPL